MIIQLFIFVLISLSCWLIVQYAVPLVRNRAKTWQDKQVESSAEKLEQVFIKVDTKKLAIIYAVTPIATGIIGLVAFQSFIGMFIAGLAGLFIPALRIKYILASRHRKFIQQLPDGIMILSSCLKGGMSLLQAIETLSEEMPAPISQEFNLIIRETKMGVSLEESLSRLSRRMPSEDLNLMNTAILVARETGGNLPEVFSRLVNSIRSKANIAETVSTMTLQGRMQGIILAGLPFLFSIIIYKTNPEMLKQMFQTQEGRIILGIAAVLQVVGIIFIRIFSRVEI